ncbi:DUF1152 domain-containing protein [Nanoarchaeota archaeon]
MKLLSCGLGGGMDIINASLIYYAAKAEGNEAMLGSSRPCPTQFIENKTLIAQSGAVINKDSIFHYSSNTGVTRYWEPKISEYLNEDVLYFARRFQDEVNIIRLSEAINTAKKQFEIDELLFVDGGGDSLILTPNDISGTSDITTNPFAGGDSKVLAALSYVDKAYLGVISVGLDVNLDGFQDNIDRLRSRNAYFGRVNLRTGEKEDYQLDHVVDFSKDYLDNYFNLSSKFLIMKEEDIGNPEMTNSHTGVVTYHTLNGNFGHKRTYVPWEPVIDGKKGVIVEPDHSWMYFFDATEIHKLKIDLNN